MTKMITCEHDNYPAISKVKYLMRDLPFTEIDVQSVLVSLMEITRNVLIHGGGRGQLICHKVTQGICLIVKDQGPWIENLDEILKGSKPSSSGLGLGISGTMRLMDAASINTSAKGTRVVAIKRYT
ncbi:anti-sigma regulatory factor [Insulibacter thermoxylanivorax]|uniref:Anti-sigma regulatory factor n=1 Tax=Insulibacter thermoxylanivorax TaxID=2749268 RepID=A0A916VFH3_9BACL|nr:ATP-binding protein [Insulibacter thermoxylanivorax]GFR37386.1 anti-sigma regulatory factor [Insulibacter thermoxylanivorax]